VLRSGFALMDYKGDAKMRRRAPCVKRFLTSGTIVNSPVGKEGNASGSQVPLFGEDCTLAVPVGPTQRWSF
jgi:hypothetical protein